MAGLGAWTFLLYLGAAGPTVALAQAPSQDAATTQSEGRVSAPDPQQVQPATAEIDDVEVVGALQAQTDRIDRRVYRVDQDPLAGSSTALEVIARIPSVTVTSSGTITLLGQGAAAVMIDGKPVANTEAIRALLGSDLDRVEVMTNPSSEFRAQGTGGVVNVILRRRRPIGVSGTVLASADTLDNQRVSLSTSISLENLTVTGNATLEHTSGDQHRTRVRDALLPGVQELVETLDFRQSGSDGTLGLSATYSFDENRSLTFGGMVSRSRSESQSAFSRTISSPISAAYDELTLGRGGVDIAGANIELNVRTPDRRLATKISASLSFNEFFVEDEYSRSFDPSAPQELFGTQTSYSTDKASFSASVEYDPSQDVVVKAGLNFDGNEQAISRLIDTSLPVDAETSLNGNTNVLAAYGSIQWQMYGWAVMPGVRAERASYELYDAPFARADEFDLFPSLHLRRPIASDWTINLSYSRRVNRPDLERLDPRPIFTSTTDISVGAPDLAPEFTDALEARLEHVAGENNASATLYHRVTSDVWQPFFDLNADQFLVQTFINAGRRTNTGLELSARRALSERFRIVGTGNVFQSEQDAVIGGLISKESQIEYSAGLALTYRPRGSDRMSDTIQWSVRYSAGSRGYQTISSDNFSSSLSWRRPISDRLSSVLTVSDLFDSGDGNFELNTPEFRQIIESEGQGPQVKWTLAYRFGALR